jgi:hypothetical protein
MTIRDTRPPALLLCGVMSNQLETAFTLLEVQYKLLYSLPSYVKALKTALSYLRTWPAPNQDPHNAERWFVEDPANKARQKSGLCRLLVWTGPRHMCMWLESLVLPKFGPN